jgi:hypothetical protein
MMKQTYAHWLQTANDLRRIKIKIAVNNNAQREELSNFTDVLIIGNQKLGPVWATHELSHNIEANKDDILILVSDDFFSPKGWDSFLYEQFTNYSGALLVDDGIQIPAGCSMTIPIMTYDCLLRINRHIYHPEYKCRYADTELFHNLKQLNLLKDLRGLGKPVFMHQHWAVGKRPCDEHDKPGVDAEDYDHKIYEARMRLPISQKLL